MQRRASRLIDLELPFPPCMAYSLGKIMNTTRRHIQYGIVAAIILIIGSWFGVSQLTLLSFPNIEEYSKEPIEVRRYNAFLIPRDGTDLSARMDQVMWHLTRPGQARLIESARLSGADDMKSSFESLGYQFPSGTSITSGGCTSPGWTIRHHSSVLDHIERYLKVARIP